jgi:uncharacterized protein YkwD
MTENPGPGPSGSMENTTSSSGSTASSNAGNAQESSSTGNAQQQSTSIGNTQTDLANSILAGNATGVDFRQQILAVHNRERAAVSFPPLVWSDSWSWVI